MDEHKLFDINEAEWNNKDWGEGISSCVYKPCDKTTIQYWEIQPGSGAAPHHHPAEQISYVQQGILDVTVDGNTYRLTPGCFVHVPAEAVHSTKNVGQSLCVNLDIFVPSRDDRVESKKISDLGHGWENA